MNYGNFSLVMASPNQSDTSLFILHQFGITIYILVYVDDIIVTGNNQAAIRQVLQALSQRFSVKDPGPFNYFLGVEVLPCSDGLILSQSKYILDLLRDTNMHESKGNSTPMSNTSPLTLQDGDSPADEKQYRQVIGKLISNTCPSCFPTSILQ